MPSLPGVISLIRHQNEPSLCARHHFSATTSRVRVRAIGVKSALPAREIRRLTARLLRALRATDTQQDLSPPHQARVLQRRITVMQASRVLAQT